MRASSNESPVAHSLPTTPPLSATPAFEIEVDLERFPILRAHVLNGRVVVPMALIMECGSRKAPCTRIRA